jgi:hypothetical protein
MSRAGTQDKHCRQVWALKRHVSAAPSHASALHRQDPVPGVEKYACVIGATSCEGPQAQKYRMGSGSQLDSLAEHALELHVAVAHVQQCMQQAGRIPGADLLKAPHGCLCQHDKQLYVILAC